jgi:hypothetical protein
MPVGVGTACSVGFVSRLGYGDPGTSEDAERAETKPSYPCVRSWLDPDPPGHPTGGEAIE